jgi:hypothetical protein
VEHSERLARQFLAGRRPPLKLQELSNQPQPGHNKGAVEYVTDNLFEHLDGLAFQWNAEATKYTYIIKNNLPVIYKDFSGIYMIFGCFRALLRQPAADISTG